ncbi:MAG: carbohydrate kinase, partial [Eubacteriales bacterium]
PAFEMNPGGGPPNCLAAVNALGAKTAFIGKVGRDRFGEFLIHALTSAGINTTGVVQTAETHTTLAFVHLDENGERSFSFLRNPGADLLLTKEDIDLSIIDAATIFHFSSLSLTNNPAREAALYAVEYAKKKNKLVSYDPNYRPLLWENEDEALYWMKTGLAYADIAKLSEEELALLTGQDDIPKGAKGLRDSGIQKVFVTMGSRGAYYYVCDDEQGFVNPFSVQAVDTTGCGDAFMGAILYQTACGIHTPLPEQVRFANATAALCATKKGGVPAMPTAQSVESLLRGNRY